MNDRQFFNQFATILSILVGIAVLILIIARVLSVTLHEPDQAMQEATAKRIKPVGDVNVGTAPASAPPASALAAAPTKAAQPAGAAVDIAEVYQNVCALCHAAGVANAPIYGDKATWTPRLGDLETLYANSLNGKGAMPAKGGRPDLSDETIKAAVDYMLEAVR